jgi:hypothetical protein
MQAFTSVGNAAGCVFSIFERISERGDNAQIMSVLSILLLVAIIVAAALSGRSTVDNKDNLAIDRS